MTPPYGDGGGEEAEVAGIYLIGEDGQPWRLGMAIGNEFSDHVTEKFNYLWLAHSKLRQCSFGPELRTGPLPSAVTGLFQGALLFFLLASDVFIEYRLRLSRRPPRRRRTAVAPESAAGR